MAETTKFKQGDRVRGTLLGYPGRKEEGAFAGVGDGVVLIVDDGGYKFWLTNDEPMELISANSPSRPLVGLASTLPPKYFAPFTSEGSEVIDAHGGSFFFVEGDEEWTTEIAEYVTKALNAYAGKES